MTPLLVHLEGQELLHVIDNPSDPKSLCGRDCWPDKWVQVTHRMVETTGPYCVTCLRSVGAATPHKRSIW